MDIEIPRVPGRHKGRVALVTGSGSGLGAATVGRLAAEGARVAAIDLRPGAFAGDDRVIEYECDVSNSDAVSRTVAAVLADFGRIDIVCNSAGVLRGGPFGEYSDDDWHLTIGVNLTGTYLVCKATLPALHESSGSVINVASTGALRGIPYGVAYAASKGGVAQLTRSLAAELVGTEVRVNAIAPGGMATNMDVVGGYTAAGVAAIRRRIDLPQRGLAHPDEMAAVISFLGSDEAKRITGVVLPVDGGQLA